MTFRPKFLSSKLMAVMVAFGIACLFIGYWQHEEVEAASHLQELIAQSSERSFTTVTHELAHAETLITSFQDVYLGARNVPSEALKRHLHSLNNEDTFHSFSSVSWVAPETFASSPTEREALRHSGESGHIVLAIVPSGKSNDQGALEALVIGPIYGSGTQINIAEQRQVGLVGWVKVQLNVQEFVRTLASQLPPGVAISIYDDQRCVVFRTPSDPQDVQVNGANAFSLAQAQLVQSRQLDWGGVTLTLQTYPVLQFWERQDNDEEHWILLVGTGTSLALGALAWILGGSRSQALNDARVMRQNLEETNSALRGVLEAMPDLVFSLDAHGKYLQYWSPRQELLAAPPQLFIGKYLQDVLPPDVVAICHCAMRECADAGYSAGHQIQLVIQGEPKCFELSVSRTQSSQGELRFIMLSRDITQRKKVEQELRDHEQQLTLALKGGEMGFWDWDFSSGKLSANERWFTMLGLATDTQISLELWNSLVLPEDLHKLEALVRDVILNPQGSEFNVEIRARHANGSIIWIQDKGAVFTRDPDGKPLRVVGTHMDVTARKLNEEKLRLSDYALKSITQGIVITALNGDIMVVNDAFCTMSGYSRSDLIGGNCRILQGPQTDGATVNLLRKSLEALTPFAHEILNYRKDGEPFWNDLEITPVFNADNEPSHFVGVLKDISEKKRSEMTMQEDREVIRINQEQLRVLSRKVLDAQETERRRVAHELHDELGQSLTAIKINLLSQQARAGQPPSAIDLENVRIVEDTLQQVRRLALALRPSLLDDLGLAPALTWLAKSASVNRDVVVNFQHVMDRTRLPYEVETACFRIVQESLTNIRRHAHASRVDILLQVEEQRLNLTVTDDGAGFEVPAPNTSVTSASLGLLGMHERAAAIGGTISIYSAPGEGSTVALQCVLTDQETLST